jgi:hypothetical protein
MVDLSWYVRPENYYKMVSSNNQYCTSVVDGEDIFQEVILRMIEEDLSYQSARRTVVYRIRSSDKKDEEDDIIGSDSEMPRKYTHPYPNFNVSACKFFDKLNEMLYYTGYPIGQHGTDIGERKLDRYWVDFYIEEYAVVVEYNERHHYWGGAKKGRDTQRRRKIESIIDKPIIIVHEGSESLIWVFNEIVRSIKLQKMKNNYFYGHCGCAEYEHIQ